MHNMKLFAFKLAKSLDVFRVNLVCLQVWNFQLESFKEGLNKLFETALNLPRDAHLKRFA